MEIDGKITLIHGIELSESCREVTWNPVALNGHFKSENDISFKHHLSLKRAVIGPDSKEGELNCIEVVAKDDLQNKQMRKPLTYLKYGTIFENNLNLTYSTPPVKFILSQGDGPVYIHSEQMIDPELQFDDDDKRNIDIDDEEVLKRAVIKAKRPFNRLDSQHVVVSKRMRLEQNVDEDEDVEDEEEDDDENNNADDDDDDGDLGLEEEQDDQSGNEDEQQSQSDDEEVDVIEEIEEEEEVDEEEEQQEDENDEIEDEDQIDNAEQEPQPQMPRTTSSTGYVTVTDGDGDGDIESDSELEQEHEQIQSVQLNASELNEYSEEDDQEEPDDENEN